MHFYYFFLLLLVVLSAYSESPHHVKPPDFLDPTSVTVCPNSSSAQLGVLAPVLPQNEVFKIVAVNCQLSNRVKTIINFVFNLGVKSFKILTSTLMHGGEKLAWTIRILLESLQHVLKMYTWSLSENLASVQFRCRLIGLLLKQSLFRKHDFAILVHKACHDYQNLCFWPLNAFLKYKKDSHTYIKKELGKSTRYQFLGGGKALLFSSDELLAYASTDLLEQQYQFLRCVKKDDKQILDLDNGNVLCSVP